MTINSNWESLIFFLGAVLLLVGAAGGVNQIVDKLRELVPSIEGVWAFLLVQVLNAGVAVATAITTQQIVPEMLSDPLRVAGAALVAYLPLAFGTEKIHQVRRQKELNRMAENARARELEEMANQVLPKD